MFTDIVIPEENTNDNKVSNEKEEKNKEIKIEVLNGTTSKTVLETVKEKLEALGYKVTKTGNTSSTDKSIIINRTMQSKIVEEDLEKELGIKNIKNSSSNSKVDFTIIIGKDYE